MQFIEKLHSTKGYKTLWYNEDNDTYYYVSAINDNMHSETMVFVCDSNGYVLSWDEKYVCEYTTDHQKVMNDFKSMLDEK